MYTRGCAAVAAGCSGGLALTGMNVVGAVIAGVTLLVAGIAILRLVPRGRRGDAR